MSWRIVDPAGNTVEDNFETREDAIARSRELNMAAGNILENEGEDG